MAANQEARRVKIRRGYKGKNKVIRVPKMLFISTDLEGHSPRLKLRRDRTLLMLVGFTGASNEVIQYRESPVIFLAQLRHHKNVQRVK